MPYGNQSEAVKGSVKFFGIPIKNVVMFGAGMFLVFGDIFIGGSFYTNQFQNVSNVPIATIVTVGISPRFIVGLGLSMVTSGFQISLWNYVKSKHVSFMKLPAKYKLAFVSAAAVALVDTGADIGGISDMMGPVRPGGILPVTLTLGNMIVLFVGTVVCLGNEACLDFFVDFDEPIIGKVSMRDRVSRINPWHRATPTRRHSAHAPQPEEREKTSVE